jgi:D-amino-acid dehydrogenase
VPPIVIIGGGVVGLCTAFALDQRGAAVTVLDAGPREQAASHVNAGWIVPTLAEPVPAPGLIATSLRWMLRSDSPLYIRPRMDPGFLRWTLRFWRHCNARDYRSGTDATAAFGARALPLYDKLREAGVDFEEHRDGIVFAYQSPRALAHDYAALEPVRRHGFAISPLLSGDELRALEPGLSSTVRGGYWLPEDRSVRPDSLVRGLVAFLQQRGVEICPETSVSAIETDGRRVTAVHSGKQRFPADAVVVAAGAWTPRVLASLRVRIPIEAGKGYSIDVPSPAGALRRPVYLHETRVAITPLHGMVRLAGTMEFSGLNHTIRWERVAAIASSASWALRDWSPPALDSEAGVRVWTGPRPMTPDGLPLIGWLPGYANLAIAAGHAMLGVTLAPPTGEAIATLLADGRSPDEIAPFSPLRFA